MKWKLHSFLNEWVTSFNAKIRTQSKARTSERVRKLCFQWKYFDTGPVRPRPLGYGFPLRFACYSQEKNLLAPSRPPCTVTATSFLRPSRPRHLLSQFAQRLPGRPLPQASAVGMPHQRGLSPLPLPMAARRTCRGASGRPKSSQGAPTSAASTSGARVPPLAAGSHPDGQNRSAPVSFPLLQTYVSVVLEVCYKCLIWMLQK